MTELLARLILLGDGLFAWLVPALLWTGALLVVARSVDELLSRRVSASWRVALYAVVLTRLALPGGWVTPLGVLPGAEARPVVETPAQVSITAAATLPALPAIEYTAPAPRVAWTAALPIAWLLGALAMLTWMVRSRRRLERELSGARAAREGVAALAPGRRVLEHDRVGPAVAGLLRPRIVIPSSLIDLLGRAELAAVLRHESAHVERRDPLLQAGVQLTLALLWPVLPLWLAAHRVRQLVEQACDERALQGREKEERLAYGEALLAVAAAGPGPVRPALGLLRFGAALRSRMKALRHGGRWPAAVQVGLVAATAFALVSAAGTRPAAAPTVDTEERAAPLPLAGFDGEGPTDLTVTREWEGVTARSLLSDLAEMAGRRLEMGPGLGTQLVSVSMADADWATVARVALRADSLHGRIEGDRLIVVAGRRGPPWPEIPRELEALLGDIMGSMRGEASVSWRNPEWDGRRVSMEGTVGTRRDLRTLRTALLERRCYETGQVRCLVEPSVQRDASVNPVWRPADAAAPRPFGFRFRAGWRPAAESTVQLDDRVPVSRDIQEALAYRDLPGGIQEALGAVRTQAMNEQYPEGEEVGWFATKQARFEDGLVKLEGRAGTKELYAAYARAASEHPRFEDITLSITELSESGVDFRMQARWVPDPKVSVSLVQLVERIFGEGGLELQRISPGRRTAEGEYPLFLEAVAPSVGAARQVEAELRAAFPLGTVTSAPLDERAAGPIELKTRLVIAPGTSVSSATRMWFDAREQMLIEFRIVEFSASAYVPTDWRTVEIDGLRFAEHADSPLNTFALDLWMQQAEQAGEARIVSAPRIMVQVGEQAEIESGVPIPIEDVSATDQDAKLTRAALRVIVTPRRTAEGIVSTWTLEVADPETRLEGVALQDQTTVVTSPAAAEGRRIAIFITPNRQGR